MTAYRRRYLCIALVLTMLVALAPMMLSLNSAKADTKIYGKTTIDKVNVRVGAGKSEKLLFQIPNAGYIGTILGETYADQIHWYRVEFKNPEPNLDRFQTGYVNADFFTPLTEEETAAYLANGTIATPTPVPAADPETGATPTPTPAPNTESEAPAGTIGYIVNGSGVNLRKGPSKGFGVITQLNRGDMVTVLTIPSVISESTFYRVRYGDVEGFVMSTYLQVEGQESPVNPVTPKPAPVIEGVIGYVETTKGGVNLRQTPGGTSIAYVGRYETYPYLLQPIEKNGYTWYFVQVGELRGYLRGDCVKEVGAPGSVTPSPVTPKPGTITPVPATPGKPATDGTPTGYLKTTVDKVNLRYTPGGKLTDYKADTKGTVLAYYGSPENRNGVSWYKVYHANAGFCYIHGSFITLCNEDGSDIGTNTPTPAPGTTTPTPAPGIITPTPKPGAATPTPPPGDTPTGYLKTTVDVVNLRQTPGGKLADLKVEKAGTILPYYGAPETKNNVKWYKVFYGRNGYCYIHGGFITLTDASGAAVATPVPTPGPTAGPTTVPGSPETEATYSTLKLGSTGNAVKNLTTELKNQGYFSGTPTTKYTSSVEAAVRKFQEAKGLSVDGIAGPATQHKLYGTVPVGSGDSNNLTMTLYPAEKIDWYTGGIQELWKRGDNYKVYDVYTGTIWWAHRWAGGMHADVETLTAADTARFCKMYGVSKASEITEKTHWQRRPCLVTIGTRTFACSLYGVPHNEDGDTIPDNNMTGQVCLHFTNSKIHGSGKVDSGHQAAIEYAWEHAPNGHK